MSQRSAQAFQLGRHLSKLTGVDVQLVYDSGAKWLVLWPDGPTRAQMRDLVATVLAEHPSHFGLMKDREIGTSRMDSTRAWAARAVAARRDGTLAEETAHGVAQRRSLGVDRIRLGILEPLTCEYYALTDCVERLVDRTAYPDRPSDPADVPLIEELLAAGKHDEHVMAEILVNEFLAPVPGTGPALRAVDGCPGAGALPTSA
ncbi:hypothetical protein [Kitasatospora kifunensis]|uniref:Uncharacterized protein n=1 Tax=Kitasatospora kifunensis TaxID=58351 RepID=A0A7W7RCG8_KITKI|nr:hypothetical protein [Kitasatospora kifunensis]MBB4929078.1 hypothetical protein [Kitasatospora kifunensis]